MDGMSVKKLAHEMGLPAARLIENLVEIGWDGHGEKDLVTGQQQLLLLRNM